MMTSKTSVVIVERLLPKHMFCGVETPKSESKKNIPALLLGSLGQYCALILTITHSHSNFCKHVIREI